MNAAQAQERGFTLVELLVVMTILGLACSVAALALPKPGNHVRREAERLAARIHVAQQQAVLQNRPVALVVTATGYAFERRTAGVWQPITEPPLAPETWQQGTTIALPSEQARIRFDATGIADPLAIELRRNGERAMVTADSRGEVDVAR